MFMLEMKINALEQDIHKDENLGERQLDIQEFCPIIRIE